MSIGVDCAAKVLHPEAVEGALQVCRRAFAQSQAHVRACVRVREHVHGPHPEVVEGAPMCVRVRGCAGARVAPRVVDGALQVRRL
jgi:hypothetical protein